VSDVVARVRERTEAAHTLRAGLELAWQGRDGAPPEGCSASLSYQRGGLLRLQARSAAFFSVFEMVAGPDSIWIDVPRERTRISGAREDPGWASLPIDPQRILVALLADPWGEGAPPREPTLDRGRGQIVLRGPDWNLQLDAEGRPATYERGVWMIAWSEWAVRRGTEWPHETKITGPEGTLRVRLGQLIPDRHLPPDTFAGPFAADRTALTPIEAKEWWSRALSE
jgi:hypothetical protein